MRPQLLMFTHLNMKNYFLPISPQFVATGIANRQIKPLLFRRGKPLLSEPANYAFNGDTPEPEASEYHFNHTGQKPSPSKMMLTAQEWSGRPIRTSIALYHCIWGHVIIQDAVVTVTLTKNIVKTAINGLQGTIKEHVSNNDYTIKITCSIIATDITGQIIDEYPEQEVNKLARICNAPESIEISSDFLFKIFGISRMAVEKMEMAQQTHSNRQELAIEGISDTDYVIRNEEY